jgi:hypothetical protein
MDAATLDRLLDPLAMTNPGAGIPGAAGHDSHGST